MNHDIPKMWITTTCLTDPSQNWYIGAEKYLSNIYSVFYKQYFFSVYSLFSNKIGLLFLIQMIKLKKRDGHLKDKGKSRITFLKISWFTTAHVEGVRFVCSFEVKTARDVLKRPILKTHPSNFAPIFREHVTLM